MTTRFLHTADWQLGKPFAGIDDPQKRALVQQERLQVIRRIGDAATHQAEFIWLLVIFSTLPPPVKRPYRRPVAPSVNRDSSPGDPRKPRPWRTRRSVGSGFFPAGTYQLRSQPPILLKPEPVELIRPGFSHARSCDGRNRRIRPLVAPPDTLLVVHQTKPASCLPTAAPRNSPVIRMTTNPI